MSEEVKKEPDVVPGQTVVSKQYLIMVDELHMALLNKMIPGMLFVQVEGMNMADNPKYQVLVNPLPQKPVEEVAPASPQEAA